jgi:hypothetical protein
MGCSHNALPPLGYVTSWKPAKAKASPKILDGPEALTKLVKEAREMIAESKAKNRGKGVVKAWSIRLVDLYKAETNSGKVSHVETCMFVTRTDAVTVILDYCKGQICCRCARAN